MMVRLNFLFLSSAVLPMGQAQGQIQAFRYDSLRVPVGSVYEYVKSNRDGTHPHNISWYIAARDSMEALKWTQGDSVATLVIAIMDWSRFSVRSFRTFQIRRGAPDLLRGRADTDSGGKVTLSFAREKSVRVKSWPWHSYDFDFASLGLTLPHLKDPEGTFTFERVDVSYRGEQLGLEDFGPVEVRFQALDRRGSRQTRLYRIGGRGLLQVEGLLWVDANQGHIVEFELPIPDEPGYRDGRLRLLGIRKLSPAEWNGHKRRTVGD
jgi:hypothetical protein